MVLRALPNLQKLDNVDVTPEEVLEAQKSPPVQPAKKEEVYEDQFNDNYVYQQTPTNFRAHSPVREVSCGYGNEYWKALVMDNCF